jgi:hypothetical protein
VSVAAAGLTKDLKDGLNPSGHLLGMFIVPMMFPIDIRIYAMNNIPIVVRKDLFKKLRSFESVNVVVSGHNIEDYLVIPKFMPTLLSFMSTNHRLVKYIEEIDVGSLIISSVKERENNLPVVYINNQFIDDGSILNFLAGKSKMVTMREHQIKTYGLEYLVKGYSKLLPQKYPVILIDTDWIFRSDLDVMYRFISKYADFKLIFITYRIEWINTL